MPRPLLSATCCHIYMYIHEVVINYEHKSKAWDVTDSRQCAAAGNLLRQQESTSNCIFAYQQLPFPIKRMSNAICNVL